MKKCALIVGHKPDARGACNETYNICEFEFNNALVDDIMKSLVDSIDPDGGIELIKVLRKTYRQLPDDVNELNPDFSVSFHCNAYNKQASGTETLYYHRSERGKKIAQIFQKNMTTVLGLKNRGIAGKKTEDRGGHLLRYTKAPCVLIEPFFIDNDKDFEKMTEERDRFIMAIQKSLFEAADLV